MIPKRMVLSFEEIVQLKKFSASSFYMRELVMNALRRHWPEYLMEAAGLGL